MANARFFKGPSAPDPAPPADGAGGEGVGGDGSAGAAPVVTEVVGPAAAPASVPVPQAAFAHIQDRVVLALLRKGAVGLDHVKHAEEFRRQQRTKEPLWRTVQAQPSAASCPGWSPDGSRGCCRRSP